MARDKVAPGATLNRKGPRVRALLRNSVRNYWWAGLSAGGGAIGAIVWVVSSLICGKGPSASART
jgi:threonine/homoserine/homoserine lactone efflux protein